jgi:hypothetical protein
MWVKASISDDKSVGIGVLERSIEEPAAFPKLARTALDLLHFDAATGDDLADWQDRGPAACYDCLLSYANQLDHRHLDRHLLRDFLLCFGRLDAGRAAGAEL